MKTYININNKAVSEKPDIFLVGRDYFGHSVYNNSIVYHFGYIPHVEILKKDFEKYSTHHFDKTVVIHNHELQPLLSYLVQSFNGNTFNRLKTIPEIGQTIQMITLSSNFIVLDNTAGLFIKVQSLSNPNWITVLPIYDFREITNI
jgi:hypothetical protein